MKVIIIGKGAFGKAMYSLLVQNTDDVQFALRDQPIECADVIVLCVPTQAIRSCLHYLPHNKDLVIVNTAKGIERLTHLLPNQIVESVLGSEVAYYSLIGPSFAQEIQMQMPTVVNLGYRKFAKEKNVIKQLFETDYFQLQVTKNIEILEISAAFKNMYAIICGIADSLGYQTNTRVQLILYAIQEMYVLFKALELKVDERSLAGTVGDLMLTCNSCESRNFKFGRNLTQYSVEEALEKVNATVEGYHSLDSVSYFEKKANIKMKIPYFLNQIILENKLDIIKPSFDLLLKNYTKDNLVNEMHTKRQRLPKTIALK